MNKNRRELNKRLEEEKINYQKKALEKLQDINTFLSTKSTKETKEKKYDIFETQSDDGDYMSLHKWDDHIFDEGTFSRGSNNNRDFNLLQNKLISPFQKIIDDTLIKDSHKMISKSIFVPAVLRNSINKKDIEKRDEIVKKVTKFDRVFNFSSRNSTTNPISMVNNFNNRKRYYYRSTRRH